MDFVFSLSGSPRLLLMCECIHQPRCPPTYCTTRQGCTFRHQSFAAHYAAIADMTASQSGPNRDDKHSTKQRAVLLLMASCSPPQQPFGGLRLLSRDLALAVAIATVPDFLGSRFPVVNVPVAVAHGAWNFLPRGDLFLIGSLQCGHVSLLLASTASNQSRGLPLPTIAPSAG